MIVWRYDKDFMTKFVVNQLQETHVRYNYRKFLKSTFVFLYIPPR